ncbi:hypothetical protein GCM10023096_33840 [Nonomuraea ferruginea]
MERDEEERQGGSGEDGVDQDGPHPAIVTMTRDLGNAAGAGSLHSRNAAGLGSLCSRNGAEPAPPARKHHPIHPRTPA